MVLFLEDELKLRLGRVDASVLVLEASVHESQQRAVELQQMLADLPYLAWRGPCKTHMSRNSYRFELSILPEIQIILK